MNLLFGLAEKALGLSENRANLLSTNLVNSSTPGYKARDIDFDKIMNSVNQKSHALDVTQPGHIQTSSSSNMEDNIMYRIPMQSSMDGNTVDPEIERKNFLQNSMKYQVSLTFIQNKTDEIFKAMKGE